MCNDLSLIFLKNYTILEDFEHTSSHEDLIDKHNLDDSPEAKYLEKFCRVEYTPPENLKDIEDLSKWNLEVDECEIPSWFDVDKARNLIENKVSSMFIKEDRKILLGGCWIILGGNINKIKNSKVIYLGGEAKVGNIYDSAKVGNICGSAKVECISGSAQVEYISGSAKVEYIYGFAKVRNIYDSAEVGDIYDSAKVGNISGSAQVEYIYNSAKVGHISGSAEVGNISGSAQVEYIYNSAKVGNICGSAQVEYISDSAEILKKEKSVKIGKVEVGVKINGRKKRARK